MPSKDLVPVDKAAVQAAVDAMPADGDKVIVRHRDGRGPVVLSRSTATIVQQMFLAVPDAEDEGLERLLLQLLNADSWDQLDDPWDSEKSREMVGKPVLIRDILRRPSDYKDGLGWFLVIDGTNTDTGERVVYTCGAAAVIVQLAGAYVHGWLPLHTVLREADRPTPDGYKPLHLELAGKG